MDTHMTGTLSENVFRTKDFYKKQRLTGWGQLAKLAARLLRHQEVGFIHFFHSAIFYGAHVAIQEEQVMNCRLWRRREACSMAFGYGRIFITAAESDPLEFAVRMNSRLPIYAPSPQAIIQTARKLKFRLKVSEVELCAHVVQRPPLWAKDRQASPTDKPTPSA